MPIPVYHDTVTFTAEKFKQSRWDNSAYQTHYVVTTLNDYGCVNGQIKIVYPNGGESDKYDYYFSGNTLNLRHWYLFAGKWNRDIEYLHYKKLK